MHDEMDIEVSLAWWLEPYLQILAFLCVVMNAEVNEERVIRLVQRAIRLKPAFR